MFIDVLNFLNANLGLITLVVGCFAIGIYIHQKRDHKREIARVILEEIRYAEQHFKIARDRKNVFLLTKKLLPTNGWYTNIYLFISDFTETDRDSISSFYSYIIFIDRLIDKITEFKTSNFNIIQTMPMQVAPPVGTGPTALPAAGSVMPPIPIQQVQLSAEIVLQEIADKVELLYNTPAADKLRELSQRKWYQL
jgi:hypothetical protein